MRKRLLPRSPLRLPGGARGAACAPCPCRSWWPTSRRATAADRRYRVVDPTRTSSHSPYASVPFDLAHFDRNRPRWKSRWSMPRLRQNRPRPKSWRRPISTAAATPTTTVARNTLAGPAARQSAPRAGDCHAKSRAAGNADQGAHDPAQGGALGRPTAATPSTRPTRRTCRPRPEAMQRALEAMRLEAQIAKDMDAYEKRPKRRFSARARGIPVRALRRRLATQGRTRRQFNYPMRRACAELYGSLLLTVGIRSNGSVESIVVDRTSGQARPRPPAAKRIVVDGRRLYAPFHPTSSATRTSSTLPARGRLRRAIP